MSTLEQVGNYSLDTQERACREYCGREGWEVDRVFREEGESAKTSHRTQLQAMLNYCASEARRREIGVVVVYKVDRLARQVEDHTMIRAVLARRGIQLRAVMETFDNSPSGKLMENVLSAMAQFDNDVRSARTVAGMREGCAHGRWMWQAPLGYVKGDRHPMPSLVPDPASGGLVRLAFERVASEQMNRREVLAELTSLGLASRRRKPLSAQVFGSMLSNPLYMSRVVVPKWDIDVPGDFEPLVTPDLYDTVQAIVQGRTSGKDRRHRDHPDFPLRRAVRCGRCSAPLTASWSRGRSGRYPYYRCPRRACGGVNVRKERLEDLFLRQLEALSVRREVFEVLAAVVEEVWRDRESQCQAVQKRLEARIDEMQRKQDRLVDAYLAERIEERIYKRQANRLNADLEALQTQLGAKRPVEIDLAQTIAFAQQLLQDLPKCWNRLDWKQKPSFLRALYPTGLTYENGTIRTPQTPWLLGQIGAESTRNADWAPPTGLDWNHLEEWVRAMDRLRAVIEVRGQGHGNAPGSRSACGQPHPIPDWKTDVASTR